MKVLSFVAAALAASLVSAQAIERRESDISCGEYTVQNGGPTNVCDSGSVLTGTPGTSCELDGVYLSEDTWEEMPAVSSRMEYTARPPTVESRVSQT
jgi:hypothetical protein